MDTNNKILILVCLIFIVGANSLWNPFIFDSTSKIVHNPDIRDFSKIHERLIYPYFEHKVLSRNDPSRPLVFFSYAVNYLFSKDRPFGYHLTDLFLHAGVALLVFFFLLNLLRQVKVAHAEELAFLSSLYFGLHPIVFGTVIYAYGRSDVLSSLFLMLGLYLYSKASLEHKTREWKTLGLLAGIYILALASKQSTIVLPAMILLYDYFFNSQRKKISWAKHQGLYFGLFGISLVYLFSRYAYFGQIGDIESVSLSWTPWEYFLYQPFVLLKYLWLTIFPANLAIDHHLNIETRTSGQVLAGWVFLSCMITAVIWLLKQKTVLSRLILFCLGIYVVILAPTSSFFPTVDAAVERRVYLPSAFFFLIQTLLLIKLVEKLVTNKKPFLPAFRILVIVHLAVLASFTLYRNHIFADPAKVWQSTLKVYPKSVRAISNLTSQLILEEKYKEALDATTYHIQYYDKDPFAYLNLASILAKPQSPVYNYQEAIKNFEKALSLDPDSASIMYVYAQTLHSHNEIGKAEDLYRKALKFNPQHIYANMNLALIYNQMGKKSDAQHHMQIARELSPDDPLVLSNYNLIYGNSESQNTNSEVPLDQVPTETILKIYRQAIAKDPTNEKIRTKYLEFCKARQVPCD